MHKTAGLLSCVSCVQPLNDKKELLTQNPFKDMTLTHTQYSQHPFTDVNKEHDDTQTNTIKPELAPPHYS